MLHRSILRKTEKRTTAMHATNSFDRALLTSNNIETSATSAFRTAHRHTNTR